MTITITDQPIATDQEVEQAIENANLQEPDDREPESWCPICDSPIYEGQEWFSVWFDGDASRICDHCYENSDQWAELRICDRCECRMPEDDSWYIEEEYDPNRRYDGQLFCRRCYDIIVRESTNGNDGYCLDA